MTNGNDSAQALFVHEVRGMFDPEVHLGLTKREHFAAMAISAAMACPHYGVNADSIARQCVEIADALISELNGEGEQRRRELDDGEMPF